MKYQKLLIALVLPVFTWLHMAANVDAPALKCASVSSTNAEISWIAPIDSLGEFDSYHIYMAYTFNGPYTLVDSVFNYAATGYTDTGADTTPCGNKLYYYVQTRYDAGAGLVFSAPSDTLATLKLCATDMGGSTLLEWNPIHTPDITTSEGQYYILANFGTGWLGWDTVPYGIKDDTVSVACSGSMYQITIYDTARPCASVAWDNCVVPSVTEQTDEKEQVLVYPNPTAGALRVEGKLQKAKGKNEKGMIMDITGRPVLTFDFHSLPFNLNLSHLPNGIYLLRIGERIERVVVSK